MEEGLQPPKPVEFFEGTDTDERRVTRHKNITGAYVDLLSKRKRDEMVPNEPDSEAQNFCTDVWISLFI